MLPLQYIVYILECSDGSYYVGQTDNLEARLLVHESGKGPRYTASRLPVTLVYQELFSHRADAMSRESQIKRWSRAKKEALINKDTATLHMLAKRRRC